MPRGAKGSAIMSLSKTSETFCMFWVKDGKRDDFLERFNVGTHVPIEIPYEESTCVLR